ncbi:Bcl-2-like protein, partial [Monkeypox virus]
MTSSA